MKKLILIAVTLISVGTPALAAEANLVALKGTVIKSNDFRGFKEFLIQNAQLVSFSTALPQLKVELFVKAGFAAMTPPASTVAVEDCRDATLVIVAGKGNVLPNTGGFENYNEPEIVSFACVNK